MNKQTKQVAAVLLVLAAVLISGCTENMSADQIAARMEAKQESIKDFSATMVMTSGKGVSIHERIMTVLATWSQQGLNSLQMMRARLSG